MKTLNQIKQNTEQDQEILIKLKDADIVEIYEDSFCNSGCETCDWGSSYGFEYDFKFADGTRVSRGIEDMYSSPVSQGDMMMFLLSNLEELKEMTKDEFLDIFDDEAKIRKYILG